MVVLRPKEHGPLTQAELSRWRGYAPHLLRATRLIERAVRLQSERDLLRSAMNDPYSGILLLNRSREILFANQTAERLLESGRGIRRRNGVLSGESAGGDKLLEDALLRVGRAQDAGIHRFKLTGGPGELPLVLMAWQAPAEQPTEDQPVMVRIVDPSLRPRLDESALRDLFWLTRAEARLACQLASGMTLEQAAEAAGVSINTARTHLARALGKTNTSRQSQLVSLVLQMAAKRFEERPS
jgi:DNA-binding CsgD family transcriptional regulator